jgi:uncharacterized protein
LLLPLRSLLRRHDRGYGETFAASERPAAFGSRAVIGTLGGLIGLGGAEFRLPLLIGLFRFAVLEAVILNKATSLVVAAARPFRAGTVPFVLMRPTGPSPPTSWPGASWGPG